MTTSLNIGDYPHPPRRSSSRSPVHATQHPHNTNCVFYVLRGLPGDGIYETAHSILREAVNNGVRSCAIVSSEDFLVGPDGKYEFSGLALKAAHRRCFERANQLFMLGVDVVVLANPNIKRAHYYHYSVAARHYYYHVEELIVGDPYNASLENAQRLAAKSPSHIPPNILQRYAQEFE